jgi:hypothetical protein
VTGTRLYSETPGSELHVAMKTASIDLDWTPVDGVNGVGSEANLRGKSSVLHLTMWALTGRSHLQADVLSWVDHVAAEFHIDGVPLFVEFDVNDGVPGMFRRAARLPGTARSRTARSSASSSRPSSCSFLGTQMESAATPIFCSSTPQPLRRFRKPTCGPCWRP